MTDMTDNDLKAEAEACEYWHQQELDKLQSRIAELEKELGNYQFACETSHNADKFLINKLQRQLDDTKAKLQEAIEIAKVYCSWCHSEIIAVEEIECVGCKCKKFLSSVAPTNTDSKEEK